MSDTILAIDIGSTKICAIIAEIQDSEVTIQGHGISKSQGVKKGAITNIELASKSIKKAINDAKRIAGSNITSATVSISNAYAKSLNSTGIVNIPHKDISIKEINRVMQTALYNANVPTEYDVIHVLPYNFRVDDQDFIEDPFGMNASRMEVDVNIIMTQKSNLSNLKKAVRSAGVEIDGIVLSGYASAIATMDEDEKELGVAVIDLGGQTSNLVIHTGNSIRYNDFLGVGSNHITNDLSMALHTPLQIAENVKIRHGSLIESSNEVIELPIIGDEESRNGVSLEVVHSVIFSRVEEALMILSKSLEKSALKEQIGAGIILTGGMTKLKGMRELAQAIFTGMPVRVGYPDNVNGLFEELKDPAFSTVVGLLLYQAGGHTQYEINFQQELLHSKAMFEDNLNDIRIGHSPNTEEAQTTRAHKDEKEHKLKDQEESDISFDDLPDLGRENKNPLKKLASWARQLF
ncbi:cell division protein FtsA [Sulfurovum sp. TSL1]|uniref:cell division protein FtsA n=1 Tax=Sulfurovum sp. TSL1 TaxID=2826994 RepID=UPI001CC3B98C|nr:cell division protein FtsA [Sulfurovum sp. TSL1]GIT99455.1 cell division protein FtsA [Sulfurovum sp. TSL1]